MLTEEQIKRNQLVEYKKQQRYFLLTSRFNNHTKKENEDYRRLHHINGSIYCSPGKISVDIPNDANAFILEMNNDTNKIMAVGWIKNHPLIGKYYVYEENNYNRYVYRGKRIARDEMTQKEEMIMKVFDILCFTGNRHMKRGQGLTSFPIELLYKYREKLDLVEFIKNMFKKRYVDPEKYKIDK
jgi:hypothetical protein